MSVTLSPQLEAMIQQRVESGHYASANDVVREALRLLEERDREAQMEHLRSLVAVGLEQAKRGELVDFTPELMDDIARRAHERSLKGDEPNLDVCPERSYSLQRRGTPGH